MEVLWGVFFIFFFSGDFRGVLQSHEWTCGTSAHGVVERFTEMNQDQFCYGILLGKYIHCRLVSRKVVSMRNLLPCHSVFEYAQYMVSSSSNMSSSPMLSPAL